MNKAKNLSLLGNSSGKQQRCDPATMPARLRNADSCEGMGTPVRQ
ncbi:hypothetical protein [Okeania sp. SIO1I7]|nr:hypothetical protein [Okeania sp. SIO1I7]